MADEATAARFHAHTVHVPAALCAVLWRGAVSGRGHGRFWLGQVAGRDVVVIAHRFAYALAHGVDALEQTPLLGIGVTTRCARWSGRATSRHRRPGATGTSG